MARRFAMPYETAEQIFFGEAYRKRYFFGLLSEQIPLHEVTPGMVADQIDKYLATAE